MESLLAQALATLTTGIYVLTAGTGRHQHSMSSSWATQVSGEPVLVMAAVDQQHVTHNLVLESRAFALNIVGHHSKVLEDYFYSSRAKRPDNLSPFALETGLTGTPLLQAALASLDCKLVSSHIAGDHTLFVGNVIDVRVRDTDRPLTSHDLPYIYLGGKVLFDATLRRPIGPSHE
ncbi:flavin reductase family protein [Candidatus Entotheonella palauensis]|uniref:Flavin reductase like domain-containing protein n=1 Tax=Candidatus Entotheonella gemina TaxID=1429439 RepID=W4M877_9BACT|nr:flavin reductase family protein [Candidatus Entotheonella palauensis]ETX06378.1 MAG: hypothetical protein ETSY2_17495 [Candidatus Entotheonella gemina]